MLRRDFLKLIPGGAVLAGLLGRGAQGGMVEKPMPCLLKPHTETMIPGGIKAGKTLRAGAPIMAGQLVFWGGDYVYPYPPKVTVTMRNGSSFVCRTTTNEDGIVGLFREVNVP